MGYAESADGCGGVVMGLGGKEGRAGINVWGFQKVSWSYVPCEGRGTARAD